MYSVVQITEDTPWVVVKDEEAEGLAHWHIAGQGLNYNKARDIADEHNVTWGFESDERDVPF